MKSYLLTITTLCLVSTGFNFLVHAKDDDNRHLIQSKFEKASTEMTALAQDTETLPRSAEAYYNRGIMYGESGQPEKALADFNKAIELNLQNAEVYFNRGVSYYELGQLEKAITDFKQAIKFKPQAVDIYYNLGIVYAELGQLKEALTNFDRAIELNSQEAELYYNRGVIHKELGQIEKALTDFNQAIELNPQYAEAYYNRGIIYSNRFNNVTQGRQDLEKAANLFLQQGNIQLSQQVRKVLQQL